MSHSAGDPVMPARDRASSVAAVCAVIGGTVWALTPLEQQIFQTPSEGELFIRAVNVSGILLMVLLTVALFRLGRKVPGQKSWTFQVGWWIVLVAYAAMIAGSVPALIFGGEAETLVRAGQDVAFLGAMLAALGAIPLGIAGLRHRRMPKSAAVLLIATLPLGLLGAALLGIIGVPDVYFGLPLTLLYGSAWIVLGVSWLRPSQPQPSPIPGLRGSTA